MVVVPHDRLEPRTLRALIEEFVTRDGAVQGHSDHPVEGVIEQVRQQLQAGEVVIVFDENDQTCTLMRRRELPRETADPQEL